VLDLVTVRCKSSSVAKSLPRQGAHGSSSNRLPTRYYIPPGDVRMELLVPSEKVTACPYKGRASYLLGQVEDKLFSDLVWTYPRSDPGMPQDQGPSLLFNEHVDDTSWWTAVSVPRPLNPVVKGLEGEGGNGSGRPRARDPALAASDAHSLSACLERGSGRLFND